MTKLYKVDFIVYTNNTHKTVCMESVNLKKSGYTRSCTYIDAPEGKFIAKEKDLDELNEYGGGIKKAEFVGYLYEG